MSFPTGIRQDLGSVLRERAAERGERTFAISASERRSWTYGEFDSQVNSVASGLRDMGVQAGDFVNLFMRNSVERLVASYAVMKLGAVDVAINAEARGKSLERMLNLAASRVLIVDAALRPFLEELGEAATPHIDQVIHRGVESDAKRRDVLFGDLLACPDRDPCVDVSDLAPATVIFTSGTTGPSKGCVLPHRALVRAAEVVCDAMEFTEADRVYTAFPLFHMRAAYLDVLAPMLSGGSVVVAPRLSARTFWSDMHQFDVTAFSLIGTAMQILWKQPPSPLDRGHRVRRTWGGPLPVDREAFRKRFGVEVLPGEGVFGMSETGMLNMSSLDPATSGKVRPIYDVRIATPEGDPVDSGQPGEILVRPVEPGVMFTEYLNMPEETVKAWQGLWFHTGDVGRIGATGELTYLGRQREMIRRSGHNISPYELEEVVDTHPSVVESAAIGVPSEMGEEEILICVEAREGGVLDLDALVRHCRGRVADFMLPQHLLVVDRLPKTPTGKVAKEGLRKQYLDRTQ